jgi:hypothetical protein
VFNDSCAEAVMVLKVSDTLPSDVRVNVPFNYRAIEMLGKPYALQLKGEVGVMDEPFRASTTQGKYS